MDKCPAEICLQIFQYACCDDGSTGRALSLVSRYVYELSKMVKLQSICVVGARQIRSCMEMLERTPARFRRVHHLFVSNCSGALVSRTVVVENQQPSFFWAEEHVDCCSDAFIRILTLVAPTLRTLNVVSNIPRTYILVPVSLPKLVELILQGPIQCFRDFDTELQIFQSLRHLQLLCFTDYPDIMLEVIAQQAPSLTHLLFSPTRASRELSGDLEKALVLSQPRQHPDGAFALKALSPTLEKIYIQPGPCPGQKWVRFTYLSMLDVLSRMVVLDRRVMVVDGSPPCEQCEAQKKWLQGDGSSWYDAYP